MKQAETLGKSLAFLEEGKEGILVRLRVQPRATRTAAAGVYENRLKLKVNAPPVDGAANKACQKFLSKIFKVPKSIIILHSGAKSRNKVYLIPGLSLKEAHEAWFKFF